MPRRPRGWMAGWAAYRYGERRPPPAPTRTLKRSAKDRLVHRVAAIMRQAREDGAPSPFAMEAPCRAGVRSGLCLAGWGWFDADHAAKQVVQGALDRIGARRPTWREGQHEHTQEGSTPVHRTRCVNCGGPLEDLQRKYCCKACAMAHRLNCERQEAAAENEAYDVAVYASLRFRHVRAGA